MLRPYLPSRKSSEVQSYITTLLLRSKLLSSFSQNLFMETLNNLFKTLTICLTVIKKETKRTIN